MHTLCIVSMPQLMHAFGINKIPLLRNSFAPPTPKERERNSTILPIVARLYLVFNFNIVFANLVNLLESVTQPAILLFPFYVCITSFYFPGGIGHECMCMLRNSCYQYSTAKMMKYNKINIMEMRTYREKWTKHALKFTNHVSNSTFHWKWLAASEFEKNEFQTLRFK